MKILIGGLPFFSKKLVDSLSEFDKNNTYTYLDPNISFWSKIRTVLKFLNFDLVYFVWGTVETNKLTDVALFLKKKVVMHWIGSDVTIAVDYHKDHSIKKRYLENITHLCEVPWIQEELSQIGVYAGIAQIVTFTDKVSDLKQLPEKFSILSYASKGKEEFYGIDKLIKLANDFPLIEIRIAGIENYFKPTPENIIFLGWINDMARQYRNCVLYLRLPEHDGLAFSVIEALANGRYVGYSCNFENTIFINNYEKLKDVVQNLYNEFSNKSLSVNLKGVEFIEDNYNRVTVLGKLIGIFRQKLAEKNYAV